MSSSASIVKNIQPHDVTAWTYDIDMQMLQGEIFKLKKNPTETTTKQIEENEKVIAEKKVALEKHCRQFGMTYCKYGTGESEVKLEGTNDEKHGVMTNGHVKMGGDSTIVPTDHIDTALEVALNEIKSPQSPEVDDIHNSNGVIESVEDHGETGISTSHDAPTRNDIDDPFVTPAGHSVSTNLFHAPTGTFQTDPFSTYNDGFGLGSITNDALLIQNMHHTGSAAQTATGVDIDKFLDDQEANYTTSAGHNGDAGMDFGGDDEMDMDTMATHAPVAEFEQPVIPGMDKYDNL